MNTHPIETLLWVSSELTVMINGKLQGLKYMIHPSKIFHNSLRARIQPFCCIGCCFYGNICIFVKIISSWKSFYLIKMKTRYELFVITIIKFNILLVQYFWNWNLKTHFLQEKLTKLELSINYFNAKNIMFFIYLCWNLISIKSPWISFLICVYGHESPILQKLYLRIQVAYKFGLAAYCAQKYQFAIQFLDTHGFPTSFEFS